MLNTHIEVICTDTAWPFPFGNDNETGLQREGVGESAANGMENRELELDQTCQ